MRSKRTAAQWLLACFFGFGFRGEPADAQVVQSSAPFSQQGSTAPAQPSPGTIPPVLPHGTGDPFRGGTTAPQAPQGTSPSGGGTTAPRVRHGTSPSMAPPERAQWTIDEAVDREVASLKVEAARRKDALRREFEARREALLADPGWGALPRSRRRKRLGELKDEFAGRERRIEDEISARREGARAAGRALQGRGL